MCGSCCAPATGRVIRVERDIVAFGSRRRFATPKNHDDFEKPQCARSGCSDCPRWDRGVTARSEDAATADDVVIGKKCLTADVGQQPVEKRGLDASSECKPLGDGRTRRPSYVLRVAMRSLVGYIKAHPHGIDAAATANEGIDAGLLTAVGRGEATRSGEDFADDAEGGSAASCCSSGLWA